MFAILRLLPLLLLLGLTAGCSSLTAHFREHREARAHAADPRLTLDRLFSEHAVLQRGMELPIWGSEWPGGRVVVELAGHRAETTADKDGNWKLKLPPLEAGGPFTLVARGSRTLEIPDILIGEVWVCSGQSNMWWALSETLNAKAVAATADHPQIRLLTVPQQLSATPVDELTTATWKVCTPQSAYEFSSVGFYFARELNQKLGVPVGVICAAWPGTRIEAWLPLATYRADKRLHPDMERFQEGVKNLTALQEEAKADFAKWLQENAHVDTGIAPRAKGWSAAEYDDSRWRPMNLPVVWDFYNLWVDGAAWFRTTVELPADWAGQPLRLRLGKIDDHDITWFNGVQIGASDANYIERRYDIPPNLVRPGRNTIAIRVFDTFHWGGFTGPEFDLGLAAEGSPPPLSLRGPWRFQFERALPPVTRPQPGGPIEPWSAQAPAHIFGGMIDPLIPFGIRGALWYQGEMNAGANDAYKLLLPLLIRSWREQWGQGDFPFYFVQLAPFEPGPPFAVPTWPGLREAQFQTLSLVPNTAMAVIVDHGDKYDIHPRSKEPVGKRLALAALARDYGQEIEYSGPLYDRFELLPGAVRIHFTHAEGLHTSGTQRVLGFMVAGADRRFYPAQAKIEGETILVRSPEVATPVAVRYGWNNAPDLNLFNAAGLPASPFRTDTWQKAQRPTPPITEEPEVGDLPYTPSPVY